MSHLSSYKNNSLKNTDDSLLRQTLEEIGLQIDFDKKKIKTDSWSWKEADVDAVLMQNGKDLPIGLKFNRSENGDKEVEIIGDFYGTGLRQEELTNKIAQVYQKHNVIATCEEARWFVDEDKIREENGEIIIEAYRYA